MRRTKDPFFIKLVCSVSMLCFSCISVAAASLAWFSSNRNVGTDGSSINIVKTNVVESYCLRPYYTGTPTESYSGDNYLSFSTTTTTDTLGRYTILTNHYETIMEVTLTEFGRNSESLNLGAITEAAADSYLGNTKNEIKVDGNSLSSIIDFYFFTDDDIVGGGKDVNYLTVDTTKLTKTRFVSDAQNFDPTTRVLSKSIDIKTGFSGSCERFYILLAYDQELIEEIYSANLGNSTISDGDTEEKYGDGNSYIHFTPDFEFTLGAGYSD